MNLFRIFKRRPPALPASIAVTFEEGGEWQRFPLTAARKRELRSRFHNTSIVVHSIMFDDGTRWDAVNGWNDDTYAAGLHGITVAQYRIERLVRCYENRR
jgi:hypothetical protein